MAELLEHIKDLKMLRNEKVRAVAGKALKGSLNIAGKALGVFGVVYGVGSFMIVSADEGVAGGLEDMLDMPSCAASFDMEFFNLEKFDNFTDVCLDSIGVISGEKVKSIFININEKFEVGSEISTFDENKGLYIDHKIDVMYLKGDTYRIYVDGKTGSPIFYKAGSKIEKLHPDGFKKK